MGKKYLETKKDSLEASVLNVWQKAVEQSKEITDNAQMLKNPEENTQKEEVELDEKPADFLSIEFRSSADVKKARKWMDKNLPGANQGFTGVDYRAKNIEFEDVDDAEGLMSKLKKAGFKFKVDHREEVNEARQLKDPKKEVMVVKGNKVIVIDKKDQKKYLQKGYKLAEASGDKEAYTKFFNSALKKFKVNSPAELKGDAKKKFYDYVDKNWEGDNEKAEAAMAQVREFKIQGMKAALASIWNVKEGKNPFKVEDDKKVKSKDEKTMTGKKAAIIDLKPKIKD